VSDAFCRASLAKYAAILVVAIAVAAVATFAQANRRHVVIITLDGFGAWALDDPYLPVPTLRKLAAGGAFARTMRPVNPSVTWPNHTSIVSGVTPARHGVLFNGLLLREPGVPPRIEPWRDRNEMVRVKTLYDEAYARGLTTAQVDWVAIQNAPTITWAFHERPEPTSVIAKELVKAGTISQADLESFATRNIVWRDEIWTAAAEHIIRQHRPNLLMFHLLNLDSTQHRYGPRTPAAMTTMAHLDTQVARIVGAVESSKLAPETTYFVVSDHGFKAVKKQIRPNAALAAAGLLTVQDEKITRAQAYVVPEGGSALVYVTVADPTGEILARTRKALAGLEGIADVIEPAQYARYGLPTPEENNQMGALFLTAKDDYAFVATAAEPVVVPATEGNLGAHGYVSTDPDLGALFIASGAGVKAGVRLDAIDNLDIAPTAAHLLGIELANVQGRVIKELLAAR
jgi:predicted AlkP superfamily pyrophosphatase or phosphodiesterase